jgi:hypothetical protein
VRISKAMDRQSATLSLRADAPSSQGCPESLKSSSPSSITATNKWEEVISFGMEWIRWKLALTMTIRFIRTKEG